MLIKAINCERLKCKGTLVWPAFLLVPIIPAIMGAGNYLNNLELLRAGWYSLWTQISLFYSNFFFAPLIESTVRFSGDSKILIRADTPF
ncbi:MAG: hypothetical protein ACLTNO_08655 [Blautia sp.]